LICLCRQFRHPVLGFPPYTMAIYMICCDQWNVCMSCEMLLARMYHLACIEVFELHMILGQNSPQTKWTIIATSSIYTKVKYSSSDCEAEAQSRRRSDHVIVISHLRLGFNTLQQSDSPAQNQSSRALQGINYPSTVHHCPRSQLQGNHPLIP
jgi:hypothetical protein